MTPMAVSWYVNVISVWIMNVIIKGSQFTAIVREWYVLNHMSHNPTAQLNAISQHLSTLHCCIMFCEHFIRIRIRITIVYSNQVHKRIYFRYPTFSCSPRDRRDAL